MQVFVKKANKSWDVDFAKMPKVSQDYIIAYGLRQSVADAAASAKTDKEAEGLCAKRIDNLLKGIIRSERTSDPVEAEARRIAVGKVQKAFRAAGRDPVKEEEREAFAAKVNEVKALPAVIAQAKANVEALAGLDIDIAL